MASRTSPGCFFLLVEARMVPHHKTSRRLLSTADGGKFVAATDYLPLP
jgi:hypothetical protein